MQRDGADVWDAWITAAHNGAEQPGSACRRWCWEGASPNHGFLIRLC